MIVIAALLILVVAVLAARLLYSLAIYALPLWCGGTLAWWAFTMQAGLLASALAGFSGAVAALACIQLLSRSGSPVLRVGSIVLFAVPAAIAGYFGARGIATALIDQGFAADLLSLAAALVVGGAAALRSLTLGSSNQRGEVARSIGGQTRSTSALSD